MPPSSQVEVDTSPMEAEARAPRLPTMAASMYCMAMELIWAKMAGTLRVSTWRNCCRGVSGGSSLPARADGPSMVPLLSRPGAAGHPGGMTFFFIL